MLGANGSKRSVEQCRKYLATGSYTAKEIEEIRDSLYQLATILVDDYTIVKEKKIT